MKGNPPGEEAKINNDGNSQECPLKAFIENLPPEAKERVKERFRQMPEERRMQVMEMFKNLPPESRPEAARKLIQRLQGADGKGMDQNKRVEKDGRVMILGQGDKKGPMPGKGKKIIVIREDGEGFDDADFTFEDIDRANEGNDGPQGRRIIVGKGQPDGVNFEVEIGRGCPGMADGRGIVMRRGQGKGQCKCQGQCQCGMRGKGPGKGQIMGGKGQCQCQGKCQCGMRGKGPGKGQMMGGQGQCGCGMRGTGQCQCGMRGKGPGMGQMMPGKGQMMQPQMGEDGMKSRIRQFAQRNPELAGKLRDVFMRLSPQDKQVVLQAIGEIKGQRDGMQEFVPQGGPKPQMKAPKQVKKAPKDMKKFKKQQGKKGQGKKRPQAI